MNAARAPKAKNAGQSFDERLSGNEAGIEIQNENRFIAAVIASIYVRMNGLTYNMTSKAKIHKAEAK